jgi:hypothetical protein
MSMGPSSSGAWLGLVLATETFLFSASCIFAQCNRYVEAVGILGCYENNLGLYHINV